MIDKVSPTDVERLRKTPSVNVFAYQGLRALIIQPSFREGPNEFIRDNSGKPLAQNPLRDVRVRQALSLAINRQAIDQRIMQGTVTEANPIRRRRKPCRRWRNSGPGSASRCS